MSRLALQLISVDELRLSGCPESRSGGHNVIRLSNVLHVVFTGLGHVRALRDITRSRESVPKARVELPMAALWPRPPLGIVLTYTVPELEEKLTRLTTWMYASGTFYPYYTHIRCAGYSSELAAI